MLPNKVFLRRLLDADAEPNSHGNFMSSLMRGVLKGMIRAVMRS